MISRHERANPKTEAGRRFKEWSSLFEGKLFVQIVVYADESGTDGIAPSICGYIATPEYWAEFCAEWSVALKTNKAPYFHFRELHRKEREKTNNPFHGWSDERVEDFIFNMARVASRQAVPFGGHVKLLVPKDKNLMPTLYNEAFNKFFDDFLVALDEHWPNFKGQADFFFEENKNDEWICTLNNVIKLRREKDFRIGTYTPVKWDSERHGIPLQAADMLAYADRQVAENWFKSNQKPQDHRIIDLILWKNLRPKGHHFHYGDMDDSVWELIISEFRTHKKLWDMTNLIMGMPKQIYYPLVYHPFFYNEN